MLLRETWFTFLFALKFIVSCLLFAAFGATESSAQVRTGIAGSIRSDELSEFLSQHGGAILDVRVDGDCDLRLSRKYKVLYIEFNSMSADVDGKSLEADEFITRVLSNRRMAAALTSRQTVLVLCCEGLRARVATDALADKGFSALYLQGGLRSSDLTEPMIRTELAREVYELF